VLLLLLTSPPRTLRAVGGGSAAGPSHSRHFAATQQFSRFRSEADIERFSGPADHVAIDPNVWSGRASQEVSSSWRLAVLHQCIRPLIGAFAPGHHGYQRACDLVSGQASTGHSGHQCSHAPGRPILHLFSSSRRPRQVVSSLRMITRLEACSPRRLGHAQERSMRCGPACWRARSPGRCGAAASWQPPARA